jgi:hypothetical protein
MSLRRPAVALFLLLIGSLTSNIRSAYGVQRTYDWDHILYGKTNTYQARVTTSDSWQVDTTVSVAFRLELTTKGSALNHTEIIDMRIKIQGSQFIMQSEPLQETETLRNAGDRWERSVSFYVPAEYVERGQTDNVSITFELTYNEIDNIGGYSSQTVYRPADGAMYVSLFRPFLSTFEYVEIVVVVICFCGVIGFTLYVRRRRSTRSKT